eukprot:10425108-Prorocentrum_lima.AAC.1
MRLIVEHVSAREFLFVPPGFGIGGGGYATGISSAPAAPTASAREKDIALTAPAASVREEGVALTAPAASVREEDASPYS